MISPLCAFYGMRPLGRNVITLLKRGPLKRTTYKAHTRIEENMTTRNEQRLITRLDKARENDARAKFAHLFRRRTTNAFTLRVLGAYQDAKIAAKAAGR